MENETWMDRRDKRIADTLPRIHEAVRNGTPPADAINKIASDNETYNAALRHYGLQPHVHD